MDAIWVQLLIGLTAVLTPFVGAALGAAALAWTPLHDPSDGSPDHRSADP